MGPKIRQSRIERLIMAGGVSCGMVFATACAKQAASISPVSMGDTYSSVSCSQAAELYRQEAAKVPGLASAQRQAVTGDAIGVFLIGVPVSSLSGGDLEGEIAATKGKLVGLGGRLDACGVSYQPVSWG